MSDEYVPPFQITEEITNLTIEIGQYVGSITAFEELHPNPVLRRENRIRSIHSSLKIEANSLSLREVRDVIDGRIVFGDQKEIQEVKNAFKAYELIETIDPTSIDDLKSVHGIMTYRTVEESGCFRKGDEGVFDGDKCIFVWVKQNKGKVHPLIMAAVFHYEFVFIHPFADGNGRMARLWHTVILYKWRNVFAYIPLESQIERFQQAYYDAIAQCHVNGNSNVFIEFMLEMINQVLDEVIAQVQQLDAALSQYVKRLLDCMEFGVPYTAREIMKALGLRSRETFRKNYLNPAMSLGLVCMTLPDKPNSRNQRYVKQ